jgi:hypothetical protein
MATVQLIRLLKYVNIADFVATIALLILLYRKQKYSDFGFFVAFLWCRVIAACVTIPILFFRAELGISRATAYHVWWGTNWIFFTSLAVLQALSIYGNYRLAMRPLEGLQKIGQIIFRWVAGVSFGLSVFFAIGPHAGTVNYWTVLTEQIHRGVSVLSLCLLLFVCLAIRPLGLTFRSHLFGVSLGLGITAATDLVEAAWYPTEAGQSLYSPVFLIGGTVTFAALILWVIYFALPEPERRMVLLPTTSPFFMWNSISQALGDDPGFVAVSGFTPDMLSAAEIEDLSHSAQHGDDAEDSDDHGGDGPDDLPRGGLPSSVFAL